MDWLQGCWLLLPHVQKDIMEKKEDDRLNISAGDTPYMNANTNAYYYFYPFYFYHSGFMGRSYDCANSSRISSGYSGYPSEHGIASHSSGTSRGGFGGGAFHGSSAS